MRWTLAAVAAVLALAAAAPAEIFKCVGPNGEVRFTSSAAQCPNALPHAPKEAALQQVEKREAPLASARPGAVANARRGAPAAPDASAESEAAWREKKAEAERNLRHLESAHDRILDAVRWCNEGYGVTKENPRTGLRQSVSCDDVDGERSRIEAELERARAYHAEGLEEECRQAGCMPGWIR